MMKYVLYHGNCSDGFTAAWVAHKSLGDEVAYIPVNYGQDPPEMESQSEVYILDFSYPRRVLLDLASQHSRVRVEDHHKTAQADLENLDFCHFDMEHSGAALAWNYFNTRGPGRLVLYVEDRDLWRFDLPHSREISAFIGSFPFRFDVWDSLDNELQMDFGVCKREGAAILRAKIQAVEAMAQHVQWAVLGGYRVPVANATVHFSEVGERLCELHPDAPFAAYYLDRADGKRQWGLRGRTGGVDVSAVAERYGGGGHAAASGFTTPMAEATVYLNEGAS